MTAHRPAAPHWARTARLRSWDADVPCRSQDAELWFAESPADIEVAKALCAGCPLRAACLSEALERREPWGVWGGELFDRGTVLARKRPRGRPRKDSLEPSAETRQAPAA